MSYRYNGYVYDRSGDEYPTKSLAVVAAILSALGTAVDPTVVGPAQVVETWEYFLGVVAAAYPAFLGGDPTALDKINNATNVDATVAAGNGNGGGNTVYRLREGIERFMVTDINNPSGSAQAQSEIFVAYDATSTDVSDYNHVPGGANVLFMDGHVEFIRYPGEPPVNERFAAFTGGITATP